MGYVGKFITKRAVNSNLAKKGMSKIMDKASDIAKSEIAKKGMSQLKDKASDIAKSEIAQKGMSQLKDKAGSVLAEKAGGLLGKFF
jgi:hypothetical protein